uniref:DUF6589 domain-containing protein n=1 Tax=Moniliophthora roreri TaxID=221103 RepID=A0A0W0G0K4_MONRR
MLISGKTSPEEYARDTKKWSTLYKHATQIFDTYTNVQTVNHLRSQHSEGISDGNMVYENTILFMQDALLSKEFSNAVKAGDSGCMVLVLKTWALSFCVNSQTKYAHEMVILIHNLSVIWPPAVRAIVLNNWLLNLLGNPNSWVEVDLMQEHFNFWIKNLTTSTIINEYNLNFSHLQQHHQMMPVVGASTSVDNADSHSYKPAATASTSPNKIQILDSEVTERVEMGVGENASDLEESEGGEMDVASQSIEDETEPTHERKGAKDVSLDMDNDWEGKGGLDFEIFEHLL